jgi:ribonuclease E
MRITMPRQRKAVKLYADPEPLFHRFELEQEIRKIHERRVPLPGGGSIVIEQTEALVAIDVNSGKYTRETTAEETAFRTNVEAAPEIARQIRLRDLGGLIIADFIDMESDEHIRAVERALWEGMRGDRARTKMLRMSRFGLVEMTRQRMRPSLRSAAYESCPDCRGSGQVKTLETMGLEVLRNLKAGAKATNLGRLEITLHPRVAEHMQNEKRRELLRLEESADAGIDIHADPSFGIEQMQIQTYAKDGSKLKT